MICKRFRDNRLANIYSPIPCFFGLLILFALPARADFTLLLRDASNTINNATAAEDLLAQPSSPSGGWTFVDTSVTRNVINVAGGNGTYGNNDPLPDGTTGTGKSNYALKATANIIIPAGTWTVGFGSDDGGVLKIPGITFTSRFRTNGTQQSADEVRYEGTRGHRWTGGTFTVDSNFETTIEAIMFEKGSGDSFELGFASGAQSDQNGNWSLMENGVNGWTIQVDPILDLDPPVITELSPADDATEVFRGTDLVATFDEEIGLTGAGSVTITDLTNGTDNYTIPISGGTVTATGSVLTIESPGTLAIDNEYAVQISADAIQDASTDNTANGGPNDFPGILDNTTWNFRTVTLDPTPPVVVSTVPLDGASFVRLDSSLEASFDDDIVIGAGNIYIHDVAGATTLQTIAVTDATQVSASGNTLTITPTTPLPPVTELSVRWDAGIVQNLTDVANSAVTDDSWSFTTTSETLANEIVIFNPGFETDSVSDGAFGGVGSGNDQAPSSWSTHVDQGAIQFSGVWNPSTADYTLEAPEGSNIAYVVPDTVGSQVGFSQVMADVYEAVNGTDDYPSNYEFIDGVDYQLKVRIGQSKQFLFSGYRIQLLAGGVILAEDVNSISVPQDTFVEATLEYAYDPANANLAGNRLEIRLLTIGFPVGMGEGVDFDDVRLTYGLNRPNADPGGPYVVAPTFDLFLDGSNSAPTDGASITLYEWDLNNDGVFGDVANVAQPEPGGISDADLFNNYGMRLGDNTIALRVTDSTGQTSTSTTNVRIELATPTPGADFELIANEDKDGDDRWEDLVSGNPSGLELLLDDSPLVTRQSVSSSTQFSEAYDFPGGSIHNQAGALLVSTGTTTQRSFQNAPGDWSNNAMSMEIWFRPDNLTPTPANGQIIFEDGGGSGLGLFIDNNELVCGQDSNNPLISYNLATDPSGLLIASPATSEFIQVLVTRTQSGETIMYVNGTAVGNVNDDGDWSGGDPAAFGTRGGGNVGGRGGGQQDTESFDGKIALIRIYNEQVLTPTEVMDNFDSASTPDVVPPFVEATSPDDDAIGVYIDSDLVATFDSDVELTGAGSVTIRNLDDGSGSSDVTIPLDGDPLDSRVSLVGRDLIISPGSNFDYNFDYGTNYAVQISNDAIQDTAATPNVFPGFLDDTSWNFTTLTQDLSAPVLVGMSPRDNAVDVSVAGIVVEATFDDDLFLGTGNITITDLDDGSSTHTIAASNASAVSLEGSVLTITPTTPLEPGASYSVRIDSGVVTNTSYVAFAGIADDSTWNFTLNTPLFYENFESPASVDAAQSTGNTNNTLPDNGNWVGATQGFGSNRSGIIDEAAGDVTDPTGEQAFTFRYTNSGLTTAEGVIGNVTAGFTYQISFDVSEDGHNSGKPYNLKLLSFESGALRNDVRDDAQAIEVLHQVTGSAPAGGGYETVSFDFSVDSETHAASLGKDLALRFVGGTSSANIDNVSVTLAVTPDSSPPTLVDIDDGRSGAAIDVDNVVNYTVSFIEDIDAITLTAADFGNNGTSSFTIGTITETEDNSGVFVVPVTPTSAGTLQLQILAGAIIEDMGGNALDTSSAINDDVTISVNAPSGSPYDTWAAGPFDGTLSNSDPAVDFDDGGLATSLEWVLGGDPTLASDDSSIVPTFDGNTDPNNVTFVFRRADQAQADANTAIDVEYGSDLNFGSTATHGVDGVTFAVNDDGAGSGVDIVTVTIPKSLATGGKIFVRLKVSVTTP